MKVIFLILLLFLSSSVSAQVTAVIDGPSQITNGDLVILNAKRSNGTHFKWLLVNSKKTFYAGDEGRVCLFASGDDGEFVFVLIVAGADANNRLDVQIAEHRLVVGRGPRPKPEPDPDPGPDPKPKPVPEGAFGLTKLCYNEAMKMPQSARKIGQQIADNFSSVASGMVAGQYTDINAANLDLKNKNSSTVANVRDMWLPWFTAESKAMQALFVSGQVKDFPNYSEAYRAVAEGLRLAALQP